MGNGLKIIGFAPAALESSMFKDGALDIDVFSVDAAAMLALGVEVQRATKALPGTGAEALFTITGGRVLVTSIVGEVTTAIQNQANNTKLQANPTAAGSSVDMCANLDVANKPVATLFSITGTASDAMASGLAVNGQHTPFVLQAGTLDLYCAATNTGSVKWVLHYLPLDNGARVVAA